MTGVAPWAFKKDCLLQTAAMIHMAQSKIIAKTVGWCQVFPTESNIYIPMKVLDNVDVLIKLIPIWAVDLL